MRSFLCLVTLLLLFSHIAAVSTSQTNNDDLHYQNEHDEMLNDGDFLFRHGDSSSDNFRIDNLRYLHPGKAGGGTVTTMLRDTVHKI